MQGVSLKWVGLIGGRGIFGCISDRSGAALTLTIGKLPLQCSMRSMSGIDGSTSRSLDGGRGLSGSTVAAC